MKNIYFCIMLLLFTGCQEDYFSQKDYPYVTLENVIVSQDGAEFIADLKNTGHSPLVSYGFVWSKGAKLDSSELLIRELKSTPKIGHFSLKVPSDLENQSTYTVRPFVRSQSQFVYGNSMFFESQGANAPVLLDYTPKQGDSGDTITVIGSNFSLSLSRIKAVIGEDSAKVVSTDPDRIQLVVPERPTISGKVRITLMSGKSLLHSTEEFTVEGHTVHDFVPKEGITGETILTISGKGFVDSQNKVTIGGIEAEIIQESENELSVRLPYYLHMDKATVNVIINGKNAFAQGSLKIHSRWSRLNDFPSTARIGGNFTIVQGEGYLIGGSRDLTCCDEDFNDFWKYNFQQDSWEQLPDFPGKPRALGLGFANGKHLYFGMGVHNFTSYKDFWKYNTETKTWTELDGFPGDPRFDPIHFTFNNKLYIVGGSASFNAPDKKIWEFDPITGTWTNIGEIGHEFFPYLDGRSVYFQNNHRAFIIPTRSSSLDIKFLHEFKPYDKPFLNKISDYLPFKFFSSGKWYSFVIGDHVYMGTTNIHMHNRAERSAIWKHHIEENSWEQVESFPGSLRDIVNAFSFENKGYIMFGKEYNLNNSSYLPEIWVYDPHKYSND